MKFTIIVEEVTIHRVEIEAKSEADAENKTLVQWNALRFLDDEPHIDGVRVLEVRGCK